MTLIQAKDVFTPNHYPEHTLVLREKDHTSDIQDAIDDLSLVSISGPSKSGKTVLVESAIGHSRLLIVTGGGIETADDVWKKVIDLIGTPDSRTITNTNSEASSNTYGVGVRIGPRIANVSGSGSTTEQEGIATQSAQTFTRDPFHLVADYLTGSDSVIFIDDFHYIPLETQKIIAQQIKELVRKKVSIVYASVPYHSDDIIRANSDLQGRLSKIDLSYWEKQELAEIARRGFQILNFVCDDSAIERLVQEAAGSPQLMQSLCLHLCRVMDSRISEPSDNPPKDITPSDAQFRQVCLKVSTTTDYENLIEKLLEGAPTRGNGRKSYNLKDGSSGDVYTLTLKALKQDPALMTIRYNALYERVRSICEEIPQSTGIMQACAKISEISGTHVTKDGEDPKLLIEFDSEDSVIAIRDPYLLYALRWSNNI